VGCSHGAMVAFLLCWMELLMHLGWRSFGVILEATVVVIG
jgi:hypothetical protein